MYLKLNDNKYAIMHLTDEDLICIFYHKTELLFYFILKQKQIYYQYNINDNKSIIYSISICL